jgi:hypothetical protein
MQNISYRPAHYLWDKFSCFNHHFSFGFKIFSSETWDRYLVDYWGCRRCSLCCSPSSTQRRNNSLCVVFGFTLVCSDDLCFTVLPVSFLDIRPLIMLGMMYVSSSSFTFNFWWVKLVFWRLSSTLVFIFSASCGFLVVKQSCPVYLILWLCLTKTIPSRFRVLTCLKVPNKIISTERSGFGSIQCSSG